MSYIFNNFSVLPELLVFCVPDCFPLFVLGPDRPVNMNVVKIGQSSSVYQVRNYLHLTSLHIHSTSSTLVISIQPYIDIVERETCFVPHQDLSNQGHQGLLYLINHLNIKFHNNCAFLAVRYRSFANHLLDILCYPHHRNICQHFRVLHIIIHLKGTVIYNSSG